MILACAAGLGMGLPLTSKGTGDLAVFSYRDASGTEQTLTAGPTGAAIAIPPAGQAVRPTGDIWIGRGAAPEAAVKTATAPLGANTMTAIAK